MSGFLKAALIAALSFIFILLEDALAVVIAPVQILIAVWYLVFARDNITAIEVARVSQKMALFVIIGSCLTYLMVFFFKWLCPLFRGALRSFMAGIRVLAGAKLLTLTLILVMGVDLFLLFSDQEIARALEINPLESLNRFLYYLGWSVPVLFFLALSLEALKGYMKKWGIKQNGADAARFSVFYSLLGISDKAFDLLMIILIYKYGLLLQIAIVLPFAFLVNLMIVQAHDREAKKGHDILQIGEILSQTESKESGILGKIGRGIQKSRYLMFLLGNLFYFDADLVTLLLRKRGSKGYKLLFFSSIYSITIWSLLFAGGVEVYSRWLSWVPGWIQNWILN